jgi:AcrR family transcriptional regulator
MDKADAQNRPIGKRATHAARVRTAIEDALLETLAQGDPSGVNHDRIAERAGLARRTVYRYYPDRTALLQAGWHRLSKAWKISSPVSRPMPRRSR